MTEQTPTEPAPLTLSEARVLDAVTEAPTTALDVRDRMGLPSTRPARENVEAVLDRLVDRGLVYHAGMAGLVTYRLA